MYWLNPSTLSRIPYKVNSFKWSTTGFEFNFLSSSLVVIPKLKSLVCPTIYLYPGGRRRRIVGFIPFSRVLAPCKKQTAPPGIWTLVAGSISYEDNNYALSASNNKINDIVFL